MQKVCFSKYNRYVALQYPFMNCVSLFITLFIFTHSLSLSKKQTKNKQIDKVKSNKITRLSEYNFYLWFRHPCTLYPQ